MYSCAVTSRCAATARAREVKREPCGSFYVTTVLWFVQIEDVGDDFSVIAGTGSDYSVTVSIPT